MGIFRITVNDGMNLVSLPLVPFSTALANVIGNQIRGANNEGDSDRVWVWNGTNYEFAWQVGGVNPQLNGQWYTGNNPTTITLGADQGAWVQVRPGNGPKDIYLLGEVSETNRIIPVNVGMTLVGTSYPVAVPLANTNLWESGLAGANNEGDSDRVWSWIGNRYEFFWLVDRVNPQLNGQWYMGNTQVERSLEPGKGYWLQRRNNPVFKWNYIKP